MTGVAPSPPATQSTRPRRKNIAIIGGVVAAIVVVLALVFAGVIPLIPPVKIVETKVTVTSTTLSFAPSSNPCFSTYQNETPTTLLAGGQESIFVNLSNQLPSQAHQCQVQSISIATSGFTLVSSNTPLAVPNTGKALLTFTVRYPTEAYTGPLNISGSVAYTAPNVTLKTQYFSWSPAQNYCGVDTPLSGYSNLTLFAGGTLNDSAEFAVISPRYVCTIVSVTANTSGFSILSAGVPEQLPINSFAGVSFVLGLPDNAYSGDVNISLNLTWSDSS